MRPSTGNLLSPTESGKNRTTSSNVTDRRNLFFRLRTDLENDFVKVQIGDKANKAVISSKESSWVAIMGCIGCIGRHEAADGQTKWWALAVMRRRVIDGGWVV